MSEPFSSNAIVLDWQDLILATLLVLFTGLLSFALRLDLHRRLAIASIRTVTQLLLVGLVLRYVFRIESWWAIAAVATVMLLAASLASVRRSSRTYTGAGPFAFLTLVLTGLLSTSIVTGLVIGARPWYQPQYLIPLLGMVLGNGLTGISLCLDTLLESLAQRRHVVEMELALGATRWEAALIPLRSAIKKGMIPIINSMSVVGIVSLPGMMTGQILAGADPAQAVRYQIVVMFMIAAATSLGCACIGVLTCRRIFNERHQLRSELIRPRK